MAHLPSRARRLFLLDGIGAALSAVMLLVMVAWPPFFGMPAPVLYRLLPFAIIFSLFALGCALLRPARWRRWMMLLAVANALYTTAVLVLVHAHVDRLTSAGLGVFVAESAVVAVLVSVELRLAWRGAPRRGAGQPSNTSTRVPAARSSSWRSESVMRALPSIW